VIIRQNTSNLARLANVLDLKAKPESKYRRLKRFLTKAEIDFVSIATLIIAILKPNGKYILALDRTEWKYGKTWVNILTLSIVTGNNSIPLFWQTLNRKGNSTLAEKQAIIDRYLRVFGVENIVYFCADREFDGVEFIRYLNKNRISFRLRLKVSMPITAKNGKPIKCGKLLQTLKISESYKLKRARKYGSVTVWAEVEKGRDSKESIIVIASENSERILLEYKRRWMIETMFQNLKSRGFKMEETHLTKAEKVDKLFGVLALAVAWATKTGELESTQNPIEIKKNGRPQKSWFRPGSEIIQEVLCEIKRHSKINIFEILRC
jgi:Transposase DDE domain